MNTYQYEWQRQLARDEKIINANLATIDSSIAATKAKLGTDKARRDVRYQRKLDTARGEVQVAQRWFELHLRDASKSRRELTAAYDAWQDCVKAIEMYEGFLAA